MKGPSVLRFKDGRPSMKGMNAEPRYQGQVSSSITSRIPWPVIPETGMNVKSFRGLKLQRIRRFNIALLVKTFSVSYPSFLRYGRILSLHSLYLSTSQLTVGSSILFTNTTRCLTPAVLASMACSLVCPPRSKPVSNSPLRAEIT